MKWECTNESNGNVGAGVLLHEASLAASIDDQVLLYGIFQQHDGLVDIDISPGLEAYTIKYPDILCCAHQMRAANHLRGCDVRMDADKAA